MNTIGNLFSSITDAIEFNKSTLSGCVDVVVVRQPDGSLKSTPFHVRFGKLKVLKSKNRSVSIVVNSNSTILSMKLGRAGEGYFEEDLSCSESPNCCSQPENKLNANEIIVSKDNKNVDDILTQNKNLTKMLQLKPSSSCNSALTKAGTENNDNMDELIECELPNQENQFGTASDLIFLDSPVDKTSSNSPLRQMSDNTSKKCRRCHYRSHSVGYADDEEFSQTVKTLKPSSKQLESLDLKNGINTVTYRVKSSLQGVQEITGNIYLWNSDANIIISDIDGTITKTDVMGHLMSMVGRDWSQPGIAPLYTNIRRNGYHILYLTSRAIGQYQQTKDFVNSIYQDGNMLPHGPLLTSPDGMISSVKREMIDKRPDIFKAATLKDVRNLFPANHNPFHAGFGNRETDAIAYRAVGITPEKVFIVNPKGDIHHHGIETPNSYAKINTMIKDIFPAILKSAKTRFQENLSPENIIDTKDKNMMQDNIIKVVS